MIKNLHTAHLKGVWQIVCNDNPSLSMKKELVIDIEKLPARTARELEKYVRSKISSVSKINKKKQKKNQLGFSGENENTHNQFVPETNPNEIPSPPPTFENQTSKEMQQEEKAVKSSNVTPQQKEANDQSSDSSFFTDLDSEDENK